MEILQQIIVMLVTLGLLIAFHEFGHFWVARRCGVRVLRFSIGFGKALISWRDKQGTEYVIAAIPLGGYVKMLDERESEVKDEDKPYAFNNKAVWQRILIVAAGPLANFLLAIFVYWFIFLQGTTQLIPIIYAVDEGSIAAQSSIPIQSEIIQVDDKDTPSVQSVAFQLLNRIGSSGHIELTLKSADTYQTQKALLPIENWLSSADQQIDPIEELGLHFYKPEIKPILEEVLPNSPADLAGLKKGDEILLADGVRINDWQQWVDFIASKPNTLVDLLVKREGNDLQLTLIPKAITRAGKTLGYVGVRVLVPEVPPELLRYKSYNLLSAWLPAIKRTWQNIQFSLTSLKKLIVGDLSYKQLSGPISIAQVANDSFKISFFAYLSLFALLSVSLGVLNLLPVPVLDGGHIFFYCIEWIKGSPVPEKIQVFAYQIGMILVLSIMLLAIFNDINRL